MQRWHYNILKFNATFPTNAYGVLWLCVGFRAQKPGFKSKLVAGRRQQQQQE